MKVIDLLNKIAKGEEVPKKIKFGKDIFTYNKECNDYIHEINKWASETLMFKVMCTHFIKEILENEVELIEEQQDIEIQGLKEIEWTEINGVGDEHDEFILNNNERYICSNYDDPEMVTILRINELIKAVKQLDKRQKEGG